MSRNRPPLPAFAAWLLAAIVAVFALGSGLAMAEESGHDHGGATTPLAADADRCDLGFNTKAYNDVIRQGKVNDAEYNGLRFRSLFMAPLPWWEALQLDKAGLQRATLGWISSDQMYQGRKKMGHLNHSLVDPWAGITDPVVCDKLKRQLLDTRDYIAQYPKMKDAFAAGHEYITPWFAGAGAHIGKWEDLDDKIEPGKPEVLIYDGNGPNANVVGGMYSVISETPPKNVFPGGNDVWHQHKGLCWTEDQAALKRVGLQPGRKVVIGGEAASKSWCQDTWKGKTEEMASLWMMHTWVVPGCTSKYGVFSHDLPHLTYKNYVKGSAIKPGCGTGLLPNAPLSGFENNELNIPGRLSTYRSSQLVWAEQGGATASGPVAAELSVHPGEAHADGEKHLSGTLRTESGFSGPAGAWPISILRETDGLIHGKVTSPAGTVATFESATAARTERGVRFVATATTAAGATVQLAVEFADPGQRGWFLDAPKVDADRLTINHPLHAHPHADGPVTYALATHPGENHVGEEHLIGTATTKTGFTGDAGVWTVSFTKNTATKAISGYLKSPGDLKRFNFQVNMHHASTECAGGVHLEATGSEQATPTDPQNPELVICDPAVTAFFADHDHGVPSTTPVEPTTPVVTPTTPEHQH